MLILAICIGVFFQNIQAKIPVDNMDESNSLATCIKQIIYKYYEKGKEITFVDIELNDKEIPKIINSMSSYSLILRKQPYFGKIRASQQGYVIYAENPKVFIEELHYITQESTWNPRAKFIIIIKSLRKDELRDVFDKIMHVHVMNVIVINGTKDADIYTYNPFENYACGRYFDRIIEYGQCSDPTVSDLYPNKLVTGLEKCTFSVTVPHFPPMTIYRGNNLTSKYKINKGTEQFAFEIISELEKFKINYSFINFAETVSDIDDNMMAKGYFKLIQRNRTDVLFGYSWLSSTRYTAFDNLYAHLAFTDTLIYVVKKSGHVPQWMNIYLEFNSLVWILLLVTFLVFFMLLSILLRTNDNISIILKLWDSFFLHGYSVRSRFTVKCVLLIWAWFAYLINAFYQSNLVSLTTYPVKAYQVSTEKDLLEYNYVSCISQSMKDFLNLEEMSFARDIGKCSTLKQGIAAVSEIENLFTITPLSIYEFNGYKFLNARGKSKVYHFPKPLMNLIYAIFLYKGFPMHKKLHQHSVYLRQSGLMDKHFRDLYYDQAKVHDRSYDVSFKARFILPWNVLIAGSTFAMIVFIIELLAKKNRYNVRWL